MFKNFVFKYKRIWSSMQQNLKLYVAAYLMLDFLILFYNVTQVVAHFGELIQSFLVRHSFGFAKAAPQI